MEQYLLYLTSIAVILFIGLFIALLSKKLKISNILLLLITGIALSNVAFYGEKLFVFPTVFLTSLGVLALVMVVFDASSRFRWKTIDVYTLKALRLAFIFLILNMLLLSIATTFIFGIKNVFLVLIFSSIMVATSPDVVFSMLNHGKNKANKVIEILRIESIVNTPLTVLIPFIILGLMQTLNVETVIFSKLLEQLKPFLMQFIVGIGAGVLIGLIVAKAMKKTYSETLSPLALITAALLTYIIAENLNGNGVLAVTVMGLLFGNLYIKQKELLYSFSSIFGNSLLILVFILVGIGIEIPLQDYVFWWKAGVLFIIYILIRYISVEISTLKQGFTFKEKLFMTLNIPKGIAVAVVVFVLATKVADIPKLSIILNLIIAFMLFSLVISTIVCKFENWFLNRITNK
ncbi:cation:proton antiporter [Candidatus Woesearchaeota archaeon]|nr:cation:proton antiporter [Candidatus Woesearchaeota archaeon]